MRQNAANALREIAKKVEDTSVMQPAVEPFIVLLKYTNASVRAIAIKALGEIGEPAVVPLISLLEDDNSSIRSVAARILAMIGEPAVTPLTRTLKDANSSVRRNAVMALELIEPDKAQQHQVTKYLNDLRDTDSSVRAVAAYALGESGDLQTVEPLIAALKDKDFRVRMNAVLSLEKLCDKRAIPALQFVEDQKNEVDAVKRAAKSAREKLRRL